MLKKLALHIKRYNPYSLYAAKSELKGEVGSSYLTWLWWILDPVLFMLVYVFVSWSFEFHISEERFCRNPETSPSLQVGTET